MSTVTITIDRTALGLGLLAMTGAPAATGDALWIPEDGVGEVQWGLRRTYAPDSAWTPGRHLLGAVREAAALPLVVYARGATPAGLNAQKAVVEAALGQWDYTLVVTVDGVSVTYRCEPSIPNWGGTLAPMHAAGIARGTVTIPVNP